MGSAVRCLIVDDSQSFRCAALSMLERGGIAVVGLAANSADGLRYYRTCARTSPSSMSIWAMRVDSISSNSSARAECRNHPR